MPAQSSQEIERRRSMSATVLMSCMFFGLGASVPFLPRWLEQDRGFSGVEIGVVLAGAQLLRLVVGPVMGGWADRFPDRRTPLRILTLVALAAYTALALSKSFWIMAILCFLAASAGSAIIPLAEGGALRAAKNGGWPFGLARSIGSFCFIMSSVLTGYHVSASGGAGVAIWLLIGGLALAGAFVWLLAPSDPAPVTARPHANWRAALRDILRRRRLILVLAAAGPIQAAHAFYYGFSSLVWREQGLEASIIGPLWACGTFMEILFFLWIGRFERQISPEWLVVLGGLGAVLRWTCLGLAPGLPLLWPLQALHALTFAACHLGAMRIVYDEIPEEHAGFAGALYAAVSGGTLLGLCMMASGWLYDHYGVQGYFAMAILALVGLGFSLPLAVRRPGHSPPI